MIFLLAYLNVNYLIFLSMVHEYAYFYEYIWKWAIPLYTCTLGGVFRQSVVDNRSGSFTYSVSCTVNRHPIPGHRAPAVTMIGWRGTALGCRRRGPGNSKWRRRL